LRQALKDPEVKTRLAASGAETVSDERARPDVLRAHVQSEIEKWGPLIRKAGVSAE
jgi:tripartite-type tricarboxylate transporter receptor subunit TctC